MTQASLANRVYETTTSTGAGAVTLLGAATPRHRTFLGSLGAAATTFYLISHRTLGEWEAGVGLVNGDGTLTRAAVLKNHLGTTAHVNFSAGAKDVFQDIPAEKMVVLEADSDTLPVPAAIRLNGIPYTFPAADVANRYLKTDGAGNLSWASILEALALTDLSDVTITAVVAGQMLRWSGTAWVNSTDGSALTALNASALDSGSVADARIVASNVTQHQAALAIAWSQLTGVPVTFTPSAHAHAATDITSGMMPDARIPASNVTQHQAALAIAWSQLTGVPAVSLWPRIIETDMTIPDGYNAVSGGPIEVREGVTVTVADFSTWSIVS